MAKVVILNLEPCISCPQDTYQDSNGATYCIPCPYSGKIWFRGADSSEQCRVYYGNFDVYRPYENPKNFISHGRFYTADAPADLLTFNGTVVGWNVELTGNGTSELFMLKSVTKIEIR